MGISPQAFEALNQRLSKKKAGQPTAQTQINPFQNPTEPVCILGIDPSLRGTGYGVIRALGQRMAYVSAGTIKCPPKWPHSTCLLSISETLSDVIREFHPEVCVVEGIFFAKNSKTALIMGQARGACIVSASRAGLPIYEIAARKVKQAIVGFGGAQKIAVATMVERMLNLDERPEPDAGDALALAMTFTLESRSHLAKPLPRI